ncbi:MAG: MazG-like family protein [bacterium]
MEKYSQEDMEHEMADIIFSALMLAKSLNIDVNKSLSNKMKKIKERFNIQ